VVAADAEAKEPADCAQRVGLAAVAARESVGGIGLNNSAPTVPEIEVVDPGTVDVADDVVAATGGVSGGGGDEDGGGRRFSGGRRRQRCTRGG
jgi:hypothetical protein